MIPYNRKLKQLSRNLRNNMTDAERRLWSRLRGKQLFDLQFYRQKIVFDYIVDFYCYAVKIIIEVDGSQHQTAEGRRKDRERDKDLKELGFKVLRFTSYDVLSNTEGVLMEIEEEVAPRLPTPLAPFDKRGKIENLDCGSLLFDRSKQSRKVFTRFRRGV